MGSANKKHRYNIKLSLIGRAHNQNDPRHTHTQHIQNSPMKNIWPYLH